jgi:hypothetical protein
MARLGRSQVPGFPQSSWNEVPPSLTYTGRVRQERVNECCWLGKDRNFRDPQGCRQAISIRQGGREQDPQCLVEFEHIDIAKGLSGGCDGRNTYVTLPQMGPKGERN